MKPLDRVRKICLSLPGATEKLAWGEPTWRAGKMFAMMSTYHHGDPHLSIVLPAEEGVQEFLRQIAGAKLVDVGGAAHMVAGDQNDAFAQAVVDFLERDIRPTLARSPGPSVAGSAA